MREKPKRPITPEERKRGWEHVQRVLRTIRSKFSDEIYNKQEEVGLFKKYGKEFLEATLANNEAGISLNKKERRFFKYNDQFRNRRLPRNFSNQERFKGFLYTHSIAGMDLNRISINNKDGYVKFRPNLERGAISYFGKIFFTTHELGQYVDNCEDCENWNQRILNDESEYAHRGVVLKLGGGVAIGYVKVKGERSFLASRTVRGKEGKILFIKGMVYSVDSRMEHYFRSDKFPKIRDWLEMDLETIHKKFPATDKPIGKLRFRHMRFIESKEIFEKLDKFNEEFDVKSKISERVL